MSDNEDHADYTDGESSEKPRRRFRDRSKEVSSKHAVKIAKQAEEHEKFINKVTHLLGVLGFGAFCFLLGARPQDMPLVYCFFYVIFVPLRWIYYRFKKWRYYLLDFCYYANTIFLVYLLFSPRNEKLFLVCFSFAEEPEGEPRRKRSRVQILETVSLFARIKDWYSLQFDGGILQP